MVGYRQRWGERIKAARIAAGHSQRSFAVAMNVDQAVVSRWERGLMTPREHRKIRIAELLDVHVDALFGYDDTEDVA